MTEELFTIIFTSADIEDMAKQADVPMEMAMERAREWAP